MLRSRREPWNRTRRGLLGRRLRDRDHAARARDPAARALREPSLVDGLRDTLAVVPRLRAQLRDDRDHVAQPPRGLRLVRAVDRTFLLRMRHARCLGAFIPFPTNVLADFLEQDRRARSAFFSRPRPRRLVSALLATTRRRASYAAPAASSEHSHRRREAESAITRSFLFGPTVYGLAATLRRPSSSAWLARRDLHPAAPSYAVPRLCGGTSGGATRRERSAGRRGN